MNFDDLAAVYIENTSLNNISMTEIEEKLHQINPIGRTDYEKGSNMALILIVVKVELMRIQNPDRDSKLC